MASMDMQEPPFRRPSLLSTCASTYKRVFTSIFGSYGPTGRLPSLRQHFTLRPGGLLVEVMMAIALFGIFATAAFLSLLTGQESSTTGSARVRGVYYTEQALEVAKAIRDSGFSNISNSGSHGYSLTDSGTWILSGSSVVRQGYTTSLTVTPVSSGRIMVDARSDWKYSPHRSGSTVLSMELTDWRENTAVGDWSDAGQIGSATMGASVVLNDPYIYKGYAYVSSSSAGGAPGMYIYALTDMCNPVRVSSTFTLPGSAHKPIGYYDVLYVAVEDPAGPDVKMYDISTPTGLSAVTTPIRTIDIPGGTGRARSLAVHENILLVGTTGHGSQDEFYAYDISNVFSTGAALLDSLALDSDPTVYDIFVRNGYAFLATDHSTRELMVIDLSNPSSLVLHDDWDATGTTDAYAVRYAGTGFYLGKQSTAGDDVLRVYGSGTLASNDPSDLAGVDAGGDVNAMDIGPLANLLFLGTSNSSKEFQVRDPQNLATEIFSDNLATDMVRGVYYSVENNRAIITTSTGMYIYQPDYSGGTMCGLGMT